MARFPLFGGRHGERVAEADSVAVLGLGRFGQSLALELMEDGTEVLGIDSDAQIVQSLNGRLTHVVAADSTSEEALRQLSIPDFDRVVVAIGTDLEASILTTSLLLQFGIRNVWAKAVTDAHGAILERLGVQHVVSPEKDMGRKVAHLVRGAMQDYVELGDDFAAVRTAPPKELVGRTLREAAVRDRYDVVVTAVRRPDGPWEHASGDTRISAEDLLLVTGHEREAEAFSRMR